MKKMGMRLVAMIESKDEKYEVINFLPDIKLLSMWDKIWFSETVPEIASGNSELLQQIREVFATNKQVLLKVSEIEKLINSHNGEE